MFERHSTSDRAVLVHIGVGSRAHERDTEEFVELVRSAGGHDSMRTNAMSILKQLTPRLPIDRLDSLLARVAETPEPELDEGTVSLIGEITVTAFSLLRAGGAAAADAAADGVDGPAGEAKDDAVDAAPDALATAPADGEAPQGWYGLPLLWSLILDGRAQRERQVSDPVHQSSPRDNNCSW